MRWIFEKRPSSGKVTGGEPIFEVFRQQVDLGPVEVLVREAIQNSLDARFPEDGQAEIEFSIREFSDAPLEEVLQALDYEGLEPHLKSVASGEGTLQDRIRKDGLEQIESGVVRVLTISDFGTRGMTGKEGFEEDEDGELGTFFKLVKSQMTTHEEADASKGGSYGLGKAIYWMMSGISTVLFYSIPAEGYQQGSPRFIGSSWLPSHETHEGEAQRRWSRDGGTLGQEDEDDDGVPRAESVWGERAERYADLLGLERGERAGTSISIVAFNDPELEDQASLEDLCDSLKQAVCKWYWPAIRNGQLNVSIRGVDAAGTNIFFEESVSAGPEHPLVGRFIQAWDYARDSVGEDEIGEESPLTKTVFDWRVPERLKDDDPHPEAEVKATLGLLVDDMESEGEASSDLANRIALMRGATGMVVKYLESPAIATRFLDMGREYYGTLLTGRLQGETQEDLWLEEFLRSAEPPAHDRWDYNQGRVQQAYRRGSGGGRTAKQAIELIGSDIEGVLRSKVRQDIPPGSRGPEDLMKLLQFGGRRGAAEPSHRMLIQGGESRLDESGGWRFTGASYGLNEEVGAWPVENHRWCAVLEVLVPEDGRRGKRRLTVKGFDPVSGCSKYEISEDGQNVTVQVDPGERRIEFNLTVGLPEDLAAARRTGRVAAQLAATYLADSVKGE